MLQNSENLQIKSLEVIGLHGTKIWKTIYHPNDGTACCLSDLVGVADDHLLGTGITMKGKITDGAGFSMKTDDDFGEALSDCLVNTHNVIVGSQRLIEFFKQEGVTNVEYYPVTIRDQEGRYIKSPYYLVHPLNALDCVNKEQSQVEYSFILENEIDSVKMLVLHEDRIPKDRHFFRCSGLQYTYFVSAEFAAAIKAQAFTGISFCAVTEFKI